MPALALDIGNYSLKAVSASAGKKPVVETAVELLNPVGVVIPSDDVQSEKLSQFLSTFFSDNNLPKNDVRLSLPESVVSTKVIEIPPLNDAELASAIGWQAEQHIPIPLEELSLEYEVLYRPSKKEKNVPMRVLMIGVRKEIINKYLNVFLDMGVEPKILETQAVSILRALQFTPEDLSTLVVNLGAATMSMFIVAAGEMKFVFSTLSGGNLLTKTLAQSINLEEVQAEQYKRTYGLNEAQFQGKVREALLPSTDTLIAEMVKAIQFYDHESVQDQIKRVLLCGGSASLPGLVEYVTKKLGVEVLVSAPFATSSGEIPTENQPGFTVCMGLIMRED